PPATAPNRPIKPTPSRNGVVGLIAGLILGVALAFAREYMDDSIKSKDDVERAAHGLATVGVIPAVPTWKTKDVPRLVSVSEPTSSAAEAYRALRTAIQFTALD